MRYLLDTNVLAELRKGDRAIEIGDGIVPRQLDADQATISASIPFLAGAIVRGFVRTAPVTMHKATPLCLAASAVARRTGPEPAHFPGAIRCQL